MSTFCRAEMGYVGPEGFGGKLRPVEVEIRDGRVVELPAWTECGFERVDHASAMQDWTEDAEIAAVHYPEAEALARSLTGFDHALVADHVKRRTAAKPAPREQHPVTLVHSDFSDDYGDHVRRNYQDVKGRGAAALARNGLSGDDVGRARRIVMLQLWRNVGPPKMDLPVAWIDARTVGRDEMVPFRYTGYVAGADPFDAVAIAAPTDPARHAWYTFPELRADEVVAFRTYDTEMVPAGTTYFTPHSAFKDPDVEVGAPARFSVELRIVCLEL